MINIETTQPIQTDSFNTQKREIEFALQNKIHSDIQGLNVEKIFDPELDNMSIFSCPYNLNAYKYDESIELNFGIHQEQNEEELYSAPRFRGISDLMPYYGADEDLSASEDYVLEHSTDSNFSIQQQMVAYEFKPNQSKL